MESALVVVCEGASVALIDTDLGRTSSLEGSATSADARDANT